MTCPECASVLREESHCGILVDCCTTCGGVWFDAGELAVYRTRSMPESQEPSSQWEPTKEDSESARQRCPRCNTQSLLLGTAHGLNARRCAGCRGIFVSKQVLMEASGQQASVVAEVAVGAAEVAGEIVLKTVLEALLSVFDL